MDPVIVEQVRRRRRIVRSVTNRPLARRKRVPRQQDPKTVALSYYSQVLSLLEHARRLVRARLVSRLPSIVHAAAAGRGDSSTRTDAGGKDVNKLMGEISSDFYRGLSDPNLENLVETYARRTSEWQGAQLARQLRAAVGVEIPFQDRGMRQRIEDFTAENVALIKSVPQRYFDQVEQKVIAGVRSGLRWEEIAGDLEDRFNVAESSAKLIARDQVGKFYGELQEARQEELGIDGYIWRTVNDNRVRSEHEDRNGQKFKWSDPPEDGHPGIPINCRCYAEPDLSGILAQL